MELTTIEVIYLICFFLGLGFAVLSGILSGVFSGGAESVGEIDMGGGTPGDIDVSGGHVHGAGGMEVGFPAINPVTISTFIASFGGAGIIFVKVLEWPMALHLPASAVSAFAVAAAVFYLFYKLFGKAQMSSAPRQADLIGLEAQVAVSIPIDGMGQITYSANETRFTAPARSEDNTEIKSGTPVRIVKIVGGAYYVQKIS